ncbi:MAG: L,D-transpeptidase [Geodermatophilaceae bacterium]|nr:L,D-transpeptidase [Geodermatophilaceae bacterium]
MSGQVVFVVIEERGDWLNVQLPVRPNGSTGWIRGADVGLSTHEFVTTIEPSEHRMTVTNAGEQLLQTPIGVGTADAPTPGGTYYIKELLQPSNPDGG